MNQWRKLLKALLADSIAFFGIQSVAVTVVYGFFRTMDAAHVSYVLLAVAAFFFVARMNIKRGIFFVAFIWIIILGCAAALSGPVRLVALALMSAHGLYATLRVGKYEADDEESLLGAGLIVSLISMGVASLFKQPELNKLYLANSLAMTLFFLAHRHLKRVDNSLSAMTMATKKSVAEVLRFNNRLLLSFLAITAACAALFPLVPVRAVFSAIRAVVVGFVMFMTYLFRLDKMEEYQEFIIMEAAEVGEFQDVVQQGEDYTTLISLIVFFIFGAIVFVLAVKILANWFMWLKNQLAGSQEETNTPEAEMLVISSTWQKTQLN